MNATVKEILRACGVVAGVYLGTLIITSTWPLWSIKPELDAFGWVFFGICLLVVLTSSGPCFLLAYFCWRRRYRQVVLTLNFVAALIVYFTVSHWTRDWNRLVSKEFLADASSLARNLLGLALSLILIFGPFCLAGWCYGICRDRIDRWFQSDKFSRAARGFGILLAMLFSSL